MLLHNAWGIFQSWIVKNVAREMKLKRDNSRYPCNWLRATRYKLSRSTGYRDQNQPVIKPSALSGDLNQRPLLPLYFDSSHLFSSSSYSNQPLWTGHWLRHVMILKNNKKNQGVMCRVHLANLFWFWSDIPRNVRSGIIFKLICYCAFTKMLKCSLEGCQGWMLLKQDIVGDF